MRYLRMRMTGSGNLRVDAVLYDFGSLPGGTGAVPVSAAMCSTRPE